MSNVISNTQHQSQEPWVRLWLLQQSWEQDRGIDDDFLPFYKGEDGRPRIEKASTGLAHLGELTAPFLLLLGRPGSGKSTELRQAEARGWLGPHARFFEAKEIGSAHPGDYISKFLPADQPTRIVIDGLDEAQLANPNFVPQLRAWLRRQLGSNGRPKHQLVLSCRWMRPIEHLDDLKALWPNGEAQTLILCPLRRCDFATTIEAWFSKTDAQTFREQLRDRHLNSISCWPQNLLGLRQSFENSGFQSLPSHGEAIREQVLSHCQLTDSPEDSPRWEKSIVDVHWRQRVAGRVAAAMIWSGRAQLSLKKTPQEDALTFNDLSHSYELWGTERKRLQLADLDDIRNHSRLFHPPDGSNRYSFQSQVHQEWLAADWLNAQKLDTSRLRMLFGTEIDGQWRVFPNLRSVAAWLARVDEGFRQLLRQHDPLTLLWLDAASLPDSERKEIITALLEATDKAKVVDPAIRQAHLISLHHPRIADQLRQWLSRTDVDEASHQLALEIAEKTHSTALAAFLWEVYPHASYHLQLNIAGTLYHLAKQGFDDRWEAVLNKEIPIDLEGTLLGAALEFLVVSSDKVPARDVLHWLVPRIEFGEEGHLYGLYDMRAGRVHEHLTADDLPPIFRHLGNYPDFIHDSLSFAEDLNQSALKLAVNHMDRPDVLHALVEYWNACVIHYQHPHHGINQHWDSKEPPFNDPALRRKLIPHLIHHPGFEKHTRREWAQASDWLVSEEDFDWCLDQLLAAPQADGWRYALLVLQLVRQIEIESSTADKFNAAAAHSAFLSSSLPKPLPGQSYLAALQSDAAAKQAKLQHEIEHRKRRQTQREEAYKKHIQTYAEQARQAHGEGQIVWPALLKVLSAREHGMAPHSTVFGPEQKIDENETWMREAAKRYLFDKPLDDAQDINEGIDGLIALSACWQEFNQPGPLRDVIASRWLPLYYSTLSSFGSLGNAPEGLSYQSFAKLFPEQFACAFGIVIRRRYLEKGSLGELRSLQEIWNQSMSQKLLTVIKEEEIQPEGFSNAIRALNHFSESDALEAASYWLERQSALQNSEDRAAMLAGCAFLVNGKLAVEVRPLLQDPDLVREAVFRATCTLDSITERQDFAVWPTSAILELANAVWRAFPKTKQGNLRGLVTGMDYAREYRDHITAAATTRGLKVEIPPVHSEDDEKESARRFRILNWNRHRAAQALAGEEWQHLKPEAFFQLTSRPHARLARSADELLQAVIESLQRWEESLRNGSWDHLWDLKTRTSRPEERIAREMRDWLKLNHEIIAEREVKISNEGRTDILVQTNVLGSPLTLVIELKKLRKSNAKERRVAMKTQLLDRYLKPRLAEGWSHGLYVIAWTAEPGSRDDNVDAMREASETLAGQAKELSQTPFTLSSLVLDTRFKPAPR
jgi:hypothetical protein